MFNQNSYYICSVILAKLKLNEYLRGNVNPNLTNGNASKHAK